MDPTLSNNRVIESNQDKKREPIHLILQFLFWTGISLFLLSSALGFFVEKDLAYLWFFVAFMSVLFFLAILFGQVVYFVRAKDSGPLGKTILALIVFLIVGWGSCIFNINLGGWL
jgi:hypothetical protein